MELDFLPSPVEDRPGLLMRDPLQYSKAVLIVPPALIATLDLFNGEASDLDLRQAVVEATGELEAGGIVDQLTSALSESGFLEDERFEKMREEAQRRFAEAPFRAASHAGGAYPGETGELRETLRQFMEPATARLAAPVAIAAPHVSPHGGYDSYRNAYSALGPEHADRIFVVLGTSHYGVPERFGLTRKDFVTPLGRARTAGDLVGELEKAAPGAIRMEDYVHATEHSIEFQVAFLQHVVAPDVRILPILCGSFSRSIYDGGMPEDDEQIARFFDALGNLAARESQRITFVMGVDMAHMGRRYGDRFDAYASQDVMLQVEARDRGRIERIAASDARGYWEQVQLHQDDLKWCGSAPFYTFLKSVRGVGGELKSYQQWNIDAESVVTFGAMTFQRT
jgi:AmmeMemoRadiSam system protein B